MIVSCLCPTFGRPPRHAHLLAEAVESFRRQRVPQDVEMELVILNDCPAQQLRVLWEPTVGKTCRVVNLPVRIPTLGQKYNAMVEMSVGSLLLPWEDDDISLPERVEQAVKMVHGAHYWKPPQVFYSDARGVFWKHNVGVRHHASVFTRNGWSFVGGYPAVTGNQDALFDQRMGGHRLPSFPDGIPPAEWQYLYRWGVSPCHLSGFPNMQRGWDNVAESAQPGTFEIKPRWAMDYVRLCAEALQRPE